jgi:hypothetical protein
LSLSLSLFDENKRERKEQRDERKKKNIEIKKAESGNVELSGCRRILVLAKMSHESIC